MKKIIWFLVVVFWLVRLDGGALTTNPLSAGYLPRNSDDLFSPRDFVPPAAFTSDQPSFAQVAFTGQNRTRRPSAIADDEDSRGSVVLAALASVAQNSVPALVVTTRPPVQGTRDSSGDMNLHKLFKNSLSPEQRRNPLTQLLANRNIFEELSAQDSNGSTPLHLAVSSGDLEALLRMLGAMSSKYNPILLSILQRKDKDGQTPFDLAVAYAVEQNNDAILQVFYGNRCFSDSAQGIDKETVLKLVSSDTQGLDLNELLLNSIRGCPYLSITQRLLSLGANINAKDQDGYSVLHRAVSSDDANRVQWVLAQQGVDVNAVDKNGNTPLHLAAKFFCLEIMKKLISKGADLSIMNNQGKLAVGEALILAAGKKRRFK